MKDSHDGTQTLRQPSHASLPEQLREEHKIKKGAFSCLRKCLQQNLSVRPIHTTCTHKISRPVCGGVSLLHTVRTQEKIFSSLDDWVARPDDPRRTEIGVQVETHVAQRVLHLLHKLLGRPGGGGMGRGGALFLDVIYFIGHPTTVRRRDKHAVPPPYP